MKKTLRCLKANGRGRLLYCVSGEADLVAHGVLFSIKIECKQYGDSRLVQLTNFFDGKYNVSEVSEEIKSKRTRTCSGKYPCSTHRRLRLLRFIGLDFRRGQV